MVPPIVSVEEVFVTENFIVSWLDNTSAQILSFSIVHGVALSTTTVENSRGPVAEGRPDVFKVISTVACPMTVFPSSSNVNHT